jgi:putative inorganic carbon (HCO3(-)) transporter
LTLSIRGPSRIAGFDIESRATLGVRPATSVSRAVGETLAAWLLWLYAAPFAFLMSAWLEKVLLAVAVLDIPFQIGGPVWKDQAITDLGSPGSLDFTITTIALCGLYAAAFLRAALDSSEGSPRHWRLFLPLTLYFGVMGLSVMVAERPSLSIVELYLLGQVFLLFLYIANRTRTRNDVLFVVVLFLISITLHGVASVVLTRIGHTVHVTGFTAEVTPAAEGFSRVGLPGSPNLAASCAATLLSVALGTLLTNVRGWVRKLAWVALCSGSVSLVLTLSRGGWLEFACSVFIIGYFALRRGWISRTLPIIAFIFALIVSVPLYSRIEFRLSSDDEGSAESRVPLDEIASRMIRDHPLMGVGANNFPVRMPDYLNTYNVRDYLATVHNTYLLIWSETGALGLIAYLWALFALMRQAWRCSKSDDPLLAPIALAFVGASVGLMLHMMVDKFVDGIDAFWAFGGLIIAIQNITKARPLYALKAA